MSLLRFETGAFKIQVSIFLETTMFNLMLTWWMHMVYWVMEVNRRPRVRLPVWYLWCYIITSSLRAEAVWPTRWVLENRLKEQNTLLSSDVSLLSSAVCGMSECFALLCIGEVSCLGNRLYWLYISLWFSCVSWKILGKWFKMGHVRFLHLQIIIYNHPLIRYHETQADIK